MKLTLQDLIDVRQFVNARLQELQAVIAQAQGAGGTLSALQAQEAGIVSARARSALDELAEILQMDQRDIYETARLAEIRGGR